MPRRRPRKLTELEKETLSHLLEGLSNQEIADEMGAEENCVKERVRQVLRKLGLQNCRQLIPLAGEIREKIEMAKGAGA